MITAQTIELPSCMLQQLLKRVEGDSVSYDGQKYTLVEHTITTRPDLTVEYVVVININSDSSFWVYTASGNIAAKPNIAVTDSPINRVLSTTFYRGVPEEVVRYR